MRNASDGDATIKAATIALAVQREMCELDA